MGFIKLKYIIYSNSSLQWQTLFRSAQQGCSRFENITAAKWPLKPLKYYTYSWPFGNGVSLKSHYVSKHFPKYLMGKHIRTPDVLKSQIRNGSISERDVGKTHEHRASSNAQYCIQNAFGVFLFFFKFISKIKTRLNSSL